MPGTRPSFIPEVHAMPILSHVHLVGLVTWLRDRDLDLTLNLRPILTQRPDEQPQMTWQP